MIGFGTVRLKCFRGMGVPPMTHRHPAIAVSARRRCHPLGIFMSARLANVVDILNRYAAGYFPLYDLEGNFYWERLAIRAMIPVDERTIARARRLARRGKNRFEIRYNTAVEEVIRELQREEIKRNSWVKEEVVKIYAALDAARLLRTIEAWGRDGKLAGALLGIDLPGTFVAETMYGVVPEASKICLCQLIEDCSAGTGAVSGVREIIDVQTPHNYDEWGFTPEEGKTAGATAHPCVRLGEVYLPIAIYMRAFVSAWKRSFSGGIEDWLAAVRSGRS